MSTGVSPRIELARKLQDALGFEFIDILQENHRFGVYLIEQDDQQRVLKLAIDKELAANLERDVRMSMFLITLGHANTTTSYRVREVYKYDKGWFIGEFFDAPILQGQHQKNQDKDDVIEVARDIWAPFMAEIASYTPLFLQQRPFYISEQGMYTKRYYKQHQDMVKWADAAAKKGIVSRAVLRQMFDYIEGNARMITYGLELRDVTPWDTFRIEGDRVGLVDLEHAKIRGRQYFDVAWSYLRFWADTHEPDAARAFLRSFVDSSVEDIRIFAPAFLTALGMKLLGYMYDTVDYMERAEKTGDTPRYNPEEMQSILRSYLEFNVKSLT